MWIGLGLPFGLGYPVGMGRPSVLSCPFGLGYPSVLGWHGGYSSCWVYLSALSSRGGLDFPIASGYPSGGGWIGLSDCVSLVGRVSMAQLLG